MTIRVLLFGHYRDGLPESARVGGLPIEIPPGATPTDVAARLAGDYPGFGDLLKRTRIAVDAEFAGPDTPLADGAEVAFLPPMSGG